MNTLTWVIAAVIFAVGSIFGMVLVFSILKKLGTLYIDMRSSEEDGIARFVFDRPLEEAAKHSLMWIKVEERRNLQSIK
jgi:hypothetical protein